MIQVEEERFARTIDQGMETLNSLLDKLDSEGKKVLDGGEAFRLYDTFGFPIDLTSEIAEERGIAIDMEEFEKCMKKQRDTARSNAADLGSVGWAEDVLAEFSNVENCFTGYEKMEDSLWTISATATMRQSSSHKPPSMRKWADKLATRAF